MRKEEFKELIEESLSAYKDLEDSPFDFSKNNKILKMIIGKAKKNELSFEMFEFFCDTLSEKELLPVEIKKLDKERMYKEVFKRTIQAMDIEESEVRVIFKGFPEDYFRITEEKDKREEKSITGEQDKRKDRKNEEEFKELIEESLSAYKDLEDSPFDFSKNNKILKMIIGKAKKNELSFEMFEFFCDTLSEKELLPVEIKKLDKESMYKEVFKRTIQAMGKEKLKARDFFKDFPDDYFSITEEKEKRKEKMSEEEFIKLIEESLSAYKDLENSPLIFSSNNTILKMIRKMANKNEISIERFQFFCDTLSNNKLLPTDIEKVDKESMYKEVFKRLIDAMDIEESEVRAIFKDFPEEYFSMTENQRFQQLSEIDGIKNAKYYNIYRNMDVETLIRIRASNFMEHIILENLDTPNKEFLEAVVNKVLARPKDEQYELLAQIEKAIPNYNYRQSNSGKRSMQGKYLPEILSNDDLLDKLVQIMIKDPSNIFRTNTINDVKEYENHTKEVCIKLLVGKEETSISDNYPKWFRKKTALFMLLYGIDYNYARNLIKKYCANIDCISYRTVEEKVIIDYLKSLKHIIELDDRIIQEISSNPDFISWVLNSKPPKIAKSFIIEKKIVAMFEREFNEKISASTPHCIKGSIRYKDKDISIEVYSPIDKEGNFRYTVFAKFIRQEGTAQDWSAPKSYKDYFNIQSAINHGDCKSFITQSQIAFWRREGRPKVGYNTIERTMYMAPWNINTEKSNTLFSPINVMWSHGKGIEFRIPDDMINNTRCGMRARVECHGETVSDRIIHIDNDGIVKLLPDNSIYIQEKINENVDICKLKGINPLYSVQGIAGINSLIVDPNNIDMIKQTLEYMRVIDKEWNETLRIAYEMDTAVIVIDREGFAIQEEMVIQRDLEQLGGRETKCLSGIAEIEKSTMKKCNNVDWSRKEKQSRKDIIREVLIRFENNALGMKTADLGFLYFTDEKRKRVIEALIQAIDLNREKNPEQYKEDLLTVEEAILEEKRKEQTNKGVTVYKISNAYMELEQLIDHRLVQIKERKPLVDIKDIETLNSIIDFIYNSMLYDNNEIHSANHIIKVTLFANMLSQKEGLNERENLLLLISASLHDCGREGKGEKDGKVPHAKLSALKAKRILDTEISPFAEHDLTEDEIKLIQVVIEYHEVQENFFGRLNIRDTYSWRKKDSSIIGLMKKYQLDESYLDMAVKLCAILKDADALDRDRIPNPDEMTNILFLHTKSAKSIRMLTFANRLNDRTAKKILEKYYGEKYEGDDGVYRLEELRERNSNNNNQCLTKEEMFEVFNEMGIDLGVENGIYIANKQEEMNESERAKINFVRNQYINYELSEDTIRQAIELIMGDFQKIKKYEEEISA